MIDPTLKQTLRATLIPLVTNLVERLISAIPESDQREKSEGAETASAPKKRRRTSKSKQTSTNKMITSRAVIKNKNRGKAPLSAYKVEKIHEGYNRNWTIRKIAEHADVSKSSVVRYRPADYTGRR